MATGSFDICKQQIKVLYKSELYELVLKSDVVTIIYLATGVNRDTEKTFKF